MWFGTAPEKEPSAKAGKVGGNFHAPPPPDKPKDWRPLGVLQYKDAGGVFEFRVVSAANLPEKLRQDLHDKHGVAAVGWESK